MILITTVFDVSGNLRKIPGMSLDLRKFASTFVVHPSQLVPFFHSGRGVEIHVSLSGNLRKISEISVDLRRFASTFGSLLTGVDFREFTLRKLRGVDVDFRDFCIDFR